MLVGVVRDARRFAVDGKPEGKGGRFDKGDFIPPPRTLSLEDRIAGRMDASMSGELKPARLVEGSTVKEFAEKLGIKPKDIVALLLQRGVFATINQPLNDDVAVDLGKRFGYDVAFVPFEEMVAEEEFEELIAADADDVELPRAPVVTVMGHVDHGKLLCSTAFAPPMWPAVKPVASRNTLAPIVSRCRIRRTRKRAALSFSIRLVTRLSL